MAFLSCSAVLCQLLSNPSSSLNVQPSLQSSNSTATVKQSLSKKRMGYMESGKLQTDDAVLMYMQRLDDHRKMCELSGRCDSQENECSSMAYMRCWQHHVVSLSSQ